jgi:hypothetical protein
VSDLWRDRFPCGALSLICGAPGSGKSLLAAAISAITSAGAPWLDARSDSPANQRGRVLWLAGDDALASVVVPRLIVHGADLSKIAAIESVVDVGGVGERSFDLQRDIGLLDALLARQGDVRLIVLDPLAAFMSMGGSDVRRALAPLCELAARRNVAVLGTAVDDYARPRLHLKFAAAARAVWYVVPDRNSDRRWLRPARYNRRAVAPELAFEIVDAGNVGAARWCAVAQGAAP